MGKNTQILVLVGLGALAACTASVQTSTSVANNASTSGQDDDRKWETHGETWEAPSGIKPSAPPPAAAAAAPEAEPEGVRPGFVGVAHDLSLAPGADHTPLCSCLAIATGSAGDPAFAWAGAVPNSRGDVMAIAISGEGVACHPKGKFKSIPTPSIAGIERNGQDMVVTVEAAHPGRPIARGALMERPGPGGAIVVRGRGHVPFGQPTSGAKGACRLPVKG